MEKIVLKNTRKPLMLRKSVFFLLAAFAPAAAVMAQTAVPPPDAGAIFNQFEQSKPSLPSMPAASTPLEIIENGDKQAVPLDSGRRVELKAVVVDARKLKTPQDDAAVRQLLQPWLGRSLSFEDLRSMAQAVTDYYRQRGFVVARAVLPPQKIADGQLTIQMVEGRMDTPVITNNTGLKTGLAEAIIEKNACAGSCADAVATRDGLERAALLLNDLPGVHANLTLNPGTAPGTTQLSTVIDPTRRVGGYLGGDNLGSTYSGHNRMLGGIYANNLLGYADQFNASLTRASNEQTWTGSLDYSLPLGAYGTRVGLRYSHLNYSLTGPFTPLDANGSMDEWGVFLTHPLVAKFNARVNLRAELFQQSYKDLLMGMGSIRHAYQRRFYRHRNRSRCKRYFDFRWNFRRQHSELEGNGNKQRYLCSRRQVCLDG